MIPPVIIMNFGYKTSRPFNLNCNAANLMDTMLTLLKSDCENFLADTRTKWQNKLDQATTNTENVSKALNVLVEAEKAEEADALAKKIKTVPKKKDDPKQLEMKKHRDDLDRLARETGVFSDKLNLIAEEERKLTNFFANYQTLTQYDLVDSSGERKFISKRLDQKASDFISGNKVLFLVRSEVPADSNSEVKPLVFDPLIVLTTEELSATKGEFSIAEVLKGAAKKRK